MTMLRLYAAMSAVCVCMAGCQNSTYRSAATTGNDGAAKVTDTSDDADAGICANRPVEVIGDDYEDGTQKSREEVVIDDEGRYIAHGLTTYWWPTGHTKLELSYRCGAKHGIKRTWYQTGEPASQGQHVNGRDHGTWTTWYIDGKKSREHHMDHGAWNGPFTVWYENGQKRFEVDFVHGVQQGLMIYWDDKGNVIKQIEYVDGKEQPLPGS